MRYGGFRRRLTLALALAQPMGATLTVQSPPVQVVSPSGARTPARSGQTVQAGEEVETGPGGAALLTFFDGSEVQLLSETRVKVVSVAPPQQGGVSLSQALGTTVNRVQQLLAVGSFRTQTPSAVALVRGTTYVISVRPVTAPPTTLPRAAKGTLNPTARAQWEQAVAARDQGAIEQLSEQLVRELAPVVVPGSIAPPVTAASLQLTLEQVSGAAPPELLSYPRTMPESPYPLVRQSVYRDGDELWETRVWEDPAGGETWETYQRLGAYYPQADEHLYVEADGSLWRERVFVDPATGERWSIYEPLGRAAELRELPQSQPDPPLQALGRLEALAQPVTSVVTTVVNLEGSVEVDGTLLQPGEVFANSSAPGGPAGPGTPAGPPTAPAVVATPTPQQPTSTPVPPTRTPVPPTSVPATREPTSQPAPPSGGGGGGGDDDDDDGPAPAPSPTPTSYYYGGIGMSSSLSVELPPVGTEAANVAAWGGTIVALGGLSLAAVRRRNDEL